MSKRFIYAHCLHGIFVRFFPVHLVFFHFSENFIDPLKPLKKSRIVQFYVIRLQWNSRVTLVNIHFFGLFEGFCEAETTGEILGQGLFHWNSTTGGSSGFIGKCPYEKTQNSGRRNVELNQTTGASRFCRCKDEECRVASWDVPDTSLCGYRKEFESNISKQIATLLQVNMKTLFWHRWTFLCLTLNVFLL